MNLKGIIVCEKLFICYIVLHLETSKIRGDFLNVLEFHLAFLFCLLNPLGTKIYYIYVNEQSLLLILWEPFHWTNIVIYILATLPSESVNLLSVVALLMLNFDLNYHDFIYIQWSCCVDAHVRNSNFSAVLSVVPAGSLQNVVSQLLP